MNQTPGVRAAVHPIVKLDYIVRVVGCPIPSLMIVSSRLGAGEAMPLGLWIALGLYGLVWPHVAYAVAARSADSRRVELVFLVLDVAVAGVWVALLSFRTVPTLALVTGYSSMLASVGGAWLLAVGLATLAASTVLTGVLVTGFAVATDASFLSTALSALLLFAFQSMLGLQTYRTARGFVMSRRRIAEQGEEIRAQNEALVLAREEALQAAQAKAAFLATMSHEIRTPLNGVLGMTRLLVETSLAAEQRDLVRTIQVSGNTLLAIINEILDYSKIESGRMELEEEPLRVAEVVEESLEIVAERAREKGIELICEVAADVPGTIRGDVTRLRQVVTNLVGNAVKFTERGEVVASVRLARAETEEAPAEIAFDVKDTGIGIPEDRLSQLFSPFSQADASTTRKYGGTGLGLAISRRLTELMGGAVAVRSAVGEGSTFSFTIQARAADEAPVQDSSGTVATRGKRVLVVDDNATNRRVLCAQLGAWGFETESADGATRALAGLGAARFDLAILDLHMPEVDGLTLARHVRELPQHRDLPLVLLSSSWLQAKDDPDQLFTARLVKPARQSKLFDTVMEAIGARARAPAGTPPESEPQRVADGAPLSILVADDNDINRKVARLVFRRFGYDVDFVVNGQEAVDRVTHHALSPEGHVPYDLVFMDVHMPEMDGLEATRAIRQHAADRPRGRWPRIVAMTADALQGDREVCLASGMDDYLTKPLDFDAVQRVLEHAAVTTFPEGPPAPPARPPDGEPPSAGLTGLPQEQDAEPGSVQGSEQDSVLDWSRLDELKEFDTPDGDLVRETIAAFVRQVPARLAEVRGSVDRRDARELYESAHALKGSATNIGAVAVGECASRLEEAGKRGHLEDVARLIEELTTALVRTLAALYPGPGSGGEPKGA